MPVSKAKGQSDLNLKVLLKILNTAGTMTVTAVSPLGATGDISITKTSTGIYVVTIANFLGPQGVVNIQATAFTTPNTAAVARTYTAASLAITVTVVDDTHTVQDDSVDLCIEAF